MQNKTLFLLLFHGSARKNSLTASGEFVKSLRKKAPDSKIGLCFLRGQKPDIKQALADAASQKFRKVYIFQLFLLPGAHVNEDIPGFINEFKNAHPQTEIKLLPCLVELEGFGQLILNEIKKHA
ncbi:MAG: CbiX/SirB N-terminal domain-containing protein [Candidatus Rifleibacteriota bacterium]